MRHNHYPGWVNALVLGVVALGVLFALPNVFGEDPSIQIAPEDGSAVATEETDIVRAFLENEGLAFLDVREIDRTVVVTFPDTEDQRRALEPLRGRYADGFTTALSYQARTPGFLRAMGLKPMALGLDLRGGVHFLFEVDLEQALDRALNQTERSFAAVLRDQDKPLRFTGLERSGNTVRVDFSNEQTAVEAERVLRASTDEFDFARTPSGSGYRVTATMREDAIAGRQARAIEQNLTTLRRRVNELGVSEPLVQQQGLNRIVIELPGVQDPLFAERIIGATATVEFRLNDTEHDAQQAARSGVTPFGSRLYYHRDGFPVLLDRDVIASGDNLTNATSQLTPEGPAVSVTLDQRGGARMARATQQNLNEPMSVVFIESRREVSEGDDGERVERTVEDASVISIATIRGVFSTNFQITGLDPAEANELAVLLRAGSLAAPIFKVEERTIGPSLGKENIRKGQMAITIGFLAVVVFMALYYRVFGLIANAALFANVVLIVAAMSGLGAALSLPGIAGIVLTVGMSVDANVLIFERIREEVRNGNSPLASIQAGYDKALSTIADANITTAIAALVLWVFGTGPVRGFAVTLFIGILTSMFTAIVGTRALVNFWYGRRQVSQLAI
jgi:preprotein translocase subunit SecD